MAEMDRDCQSVSQASRTKSPLSVSDVMGREYLQ